VLKPVDDNPLEHESFCRELIEKVIASSGFRIRRKTIGETVPRAENHEMRILEKFTADVIIPKKRPEISKIKTDTIIAIGASTGGTEAVTSILTRLSEEVPGIVIVQHMPEKFTKAFADRVNGLSKIYVREAEQGDRLYRGVALVAPGNRHILLNRDTNGYWVEINDGPAVNRHKPSVDVLFRSTAQTAASNSVGILLTGMGADGAAALLEMKESGAKTIAQDEASSVVFGMPREAIRLGAADMVKNLDEIATYIESLRIKQSAAR
jgi:two-component system chemotaxis response regulator CheB